MKTENDVLLAKIMERLENIQKDVAEIKVDIREVKIGYVTKTEFELTVRPLQKIVYGVVGLILTAVVTAILAIVIVNGKI